MHTTQFTRLAVGVLALVAIAAGSHRDGSLRVASPSAFDTVAATQEAQRVDSAALSRNDANGYHRRRP
jgi:hypothetical protein